MGISIMGNLLSPGGEIGSGATINGVPVMDIGTLPLVNGDLPGPSFITDGIGQCIGCPLV
jgi:hypothetical protein